MSVTGLAGCEAYRAEVSDRCPGESWDSSLAACEAHLPAVYSCEHWSDYLQRGVFARPWFMTTYNDENTVTGQLLAFSEYPLSRTTYAWRTSRLLAAVGHALLPVLSWDCGPVVMNPEKEVEVHEAFASAVAALQEKKGLPIVRNAALRPLDPGNVDGIRRAWEEAGFEITPAATLCVDLSPTIEELHAGLHKTARKNLRKCEREGVEVLRVGEPEAPNIEEYGDLLLQQGKVFSRGPRANQVLRLMWEMLQAQNSVEIFLARRGEDWLGGLGLWHFAGYGIEFASWTAPVAVEKRLPGGDALKWAIIKWSKENGLRWYDLAGVAVAPEPGSKEAGIRRFKEKWGAEYREYCLVDRQLRTLRTRIYSAVRKWQTRQCT